MSKAKRIIHAFKFGEKDTDHVAVVDKAANLQTVLTMKAAEPEVVVEMTMHDFLRKFFDMWHDDAATLAGILGYSTEGSWTDDMSYEEYIEYKIDSVSLLKGQNLPDKLPDSFVKRIATLQKQIGDKLISDKEESPQSDEKNVEKGDSSTMDEVTISKEELEALKKSVNSVEQLQAQLEKSNSIQEQLQAQLEQTQKDKMADVVKGYSFISEDTQEDMVATLLKCSSEDQKVLLTALEKARDAINSVVDEESGANADNESEADVSDVEKGNDITTELLKNRNK